MVSIWELHRLEKKRPVGDPHSAISRRNGRRTSDDQVDIRKELLAVLKQAGMAMMESVEDSVCVDPDGLATINWGRILVGINNKTTLRWIFKRHIGQFKGQVRTGGKFDLRRVWQSGRAPSHVQASTAPENTRQPSEADFSHLDFFQSATVSTARNSFHHSFREISLIVGNSSVLRLYMPDPSVPSFRSSSHHPLL